MTNSIGKPERVKITHNAMKQGKQIISDLPKLQPGITVP